MTWKSSVRPERHFCAPARSAAVVWDKMWLPLSIPAFVNFQLLCQTNPTNWLRDFTSPNVYLLINDIRTFFIKASSSGVVNLCTRSNIPSVWMHRVINSDSDYLKIGWLCGSYLELIKLLDFPEPNSLHMNHFGTEWIVLPEFPT